MGTESTATFLIALSVSVGMWVLSRAIDRFALAPAPGGQNDSFDLLLRNDLRNRVQSLEEELRRCYETMRADNEKMELRIAQLEREQVTPHTQQVIIGGDAVGQTKTEEK